MNPFLTAEWRNLINLTYEVPIESLQPILPEGIEADLWNGKAHVSLVAFDFLNTKVKGIKIPFHVNFPEINLRYYVKQGDKRGVMFVREYVPKTCISLVANKIYNEPYHTRKMESSTRTSGESINVEHKIFSEGKSCDLQVQAGMQLPLPGKDTPDFFFKEHEWGFGVSKKNELLVYQVKHPEWEIREIIALKLNWDFGLLYGEEWTFLNVAKPAFSIFCVGSEVSVFPAAKN